MSFVAMVLAQLRAGSRSGVIAGEKWMSTWVSRKTYACGRQIVYRVILRWMGSVPDAEVLTLTLPLTLPLPLTLTLH